LFVNHLGNFLFCPEISNHFITGAEPTYHERVTVNRSALTRTRKTFMAQVDKLLKDDIKQLYEL
jgi:hypothetical protein